MTNPQMLDKVTEAILLEARDNGADSPVDLGDAEQLAKAAIAAMHSAHIITEDEVERVARAIEQHFVDHFGTVVDRDGPSPTVDTRNRIIFNSLNLARAAIQALKG